MNKRFLLAIVLVAALIVSACGPAAPAGGGEAAPAAQEEAAPSGTGVAEFHPAWPYAPPPTGHFNTWGDQRHDPRHLPRP